MMIKFYDHSMAAIPVANDGHGIQDSPSEITVSSYAGDGDAVPFVNLHIDERIAGADAGIGITPEQARELAAHLVAAADAMNSEQTRAKLAELVKHYRESEAERDGWLSDYLDDDGELINPSDFYRAGELQTDKAHAAETDLLALLDEIEALFRD